MITALLGSLLLAVASQVPDAGGVSSLDAVALPDDAGVPDMVDAGPPPDVVVPPTASCPGTPEYPPSEKSSGVQGSVILRVTISETGEVSALEVARPLGTEFDAAALASAKQCTFAAATVNGKPMPAMIEMSVDFVPPVQPWTLEGDVVGELGEALSNATVAYGGKTVTTDENGHFSLTFESLPPGDAWVLVTHDGFSERGFPELFKSGQVTKARYELKKVKVFETRVEGSRLLAAVPEPDRSPQVSRFTITKADIDRTPGAMEDVARVAQQAPGVAADPDLLGTMFVRGGGPNETIFYLDGVPLQNPYHLGGFASVFNPMMLDSAEFYTGGVPGRYEPSLSGALEVHYATGEGVKKPRVLADVSMLTAKLRADIPLGVEGLTAIVSARRSYFETYFAALRAIGIIKGSFVAPEITELMARVNYRRGRHNTTATYLFASDGIGFNLGANEQVFGFSGGLSISNRSHLAILSHKIEFSGDSHLRFVAAYTHDDNTIDISNERSFANDANRDDFMFRADGVWAHSARNNTRVGVQYSHRRLAVEGEVGDSRSIAPWRQDPFVETYLPYLTIAPQVTNDLVAAYLEHTFKPVEPLTLEASGRAQLDARNTRVSGSARLAAAWTLPIATVLKLSGGMSAQPVQTPLLLDPTFGTPSLLPERSYQVVVGVEQPLPIEALVRLEAWGKYLDNLVVNPDSQATLDERTAQGLPAYVNAGTGFARGADLLLFGRTRYIQYGLSAGLLWSDRTNPLATAGPQTYATPWDQRFQSNVSVSWSPTSNWIFTGRFTFRTGRPYTQVVSFTEDFANNRYVPVFGDTNGSRYPGFYEFNVRAEQRFRLGPLQMAWYAEILNVTYSNNVFAYTYSKGDLANGVPPERGALNHLPIRPYLGLRAEY